MEECIYCVCKETYAYSSFVRHSYGIAAAVMTDGVLSVMECISDISEDKHRVRALADACNRLKLDPIHLREVVNDFLSE